MKNVTDITKTRHFNVRAIVATVVTLVIVSGIAAFLIVTVTSKAIINAVADPAYVNHNAQLKADAARKFELSLSPKGN